MQILLAVSMNCHVQTINVIIRLRIRLEFETPGQLKPQSVLLKAQFFTLSCRNTTRQNSVNYFNFVLVTNISEKHI